MRNNLCDKCLKLCKHRNTSIEIEVISCSISREKTTNRIHQSKLFEAI